MEWNVFFDDGWIKGKKSKFRGLKEQNLYRLLYVPLLAIDITENIASLDISYL